MKRKHENTKPGPLGAKQGPWPGTASREDMLAVLDNAPCCIVIFKWPRGKILYINRKTLEVTGYPVTELPTSRAVEKTLFHDPKERRQVRKVLNEDVLKGDVTVVYKNRVKDGAIRFIQADCTMLNGMVMMFMTDVTRREEAEAEVRESESRFRSFFEESAEAILLYDGDTIIDCNPAALTMLGFSNRKAIAGIELTALSPDKQPDGRSSMKKVKSLMALARKKKSHRFEWIFVRPDGSPFPAELIVTAIRLEGKPAFCISLRDISVWKKAEGGLVASKRDLERRVKERTRELSSLNRRLLREIETRKTFGRELEKSREQLRRLSEPSIRQGKPRGPVLPEKSMTSWANLLCLENRPYVPRQWCARRLRIAAGADKDYGGTDQRRHPCRKGYLLPAPSPYARSLRPARRPAMVLTRI